MRDPGLWQRLKAAEITLEGQPADDRLRRRFSIDRVGAQALIGEYKRFLYLVAISGEVLAPSRVVDQLWHLHLSDDASWRDFCDRVIGKPLYHIEGRPAPMNDPAYHRTRALLRQEFGAPANDRYWPVSLTWQQRLRLPGLFALIGCGLAIVTAPGLGFARAIWVFGAGLIVAALVWAAQADFALRRRNDGCGAVCGGDGDGGCGGGGGD